MLSVCRRQVDRDDRSFTFAVEALGDGRAAAGDLSFLVPRQRLDSESETSDGISSAHDSSAATDSNDDLPS